MPDSPQNGAAKPSAAGQAQTNPWTVIGNERTDQIRLIVNGGIIIVAILAALGALAIVLWSNKLVETNGKLTASDVVAVLGAVTTFLGTAVGVFFGVNVGQSGSAQAAAANANAVGARIAADKAHEKSDAASQDASAAKDASANANQRVDNLKPVLNALNEKIETPGVTDGKPDVNSLIDSI